MEEAERLAKALKRLFELGRDEAVDLADELDSLYNQLKFEAMGALWDPEQRRGEAEKLVEMAAELLGKKDRSLLETLALVALLDAISTSVYDRFLLYGAEEE